MLDNRFNTFLEVCKYMSYTKAAKNLYVTQPAVSQHIRYIEDRYGIKLFHYQGRNLSLTKEGVLLLKYIKEINAAEVHYEEAIRGLKNKVRHMNFGATLTIGEFSIEPLLDKLFERLYNHDISIYIDNTKTLLSMLKKGEIEFALIEGFVDKNDFKVSKLKLEDFIMIVSPGNPLANKKSVDIEAILSNTILVREKGSGSRDILEKGLAERNITFNDFSKVIEVGNINLIKSMTMKDLGITFLYKDAVVKEMLNGDLVQVEINQFNLVREFNFVTLNNPLLIEQTSEFYNYFYNIFNESNL